jgi:hypothetical protein
MKDFTKSDLANGMIVEQRCGMRKIVIEDRIVGYESYGELENYEDNLLHQNQPALDIVKIYKPADTIRLALHSNILQLLWERSEVKEVTIAEVEEKFGCKVKIVEDGEK